MMKIDDVNDENALDANNEILKILNIVDTNEVEGSLHTHESNHFMHHFLHKMKVN